jgi:mRNA interferase YafQ
VYSFEFTGKFKKDFKRCEKRNYDTTLLEEVLDLLQENGKLAAKFKPHVLSGNYDKYWECHIKPDWLLIWIQNDETKEIVLVRTGTHSDLF